MQCDPQNLTDLNDDKSKYENTCTLGLKLYIIFTTLVAILASAAFLLIFFHADYDSRLLIRLGLKEPPTETNWAVVGWNNTLEKLGYDSDIVFFGDSITYGSDFRDFFANKKIVNLGRPGDNLSGMTERITMIEAVSPEQVFVMGGINGLKDSNIDEWVEKYSTLLDSMVEAIPNAEIYVQSVLPISFSQEMTYCHNATINNFNEELKRLAEERGLTYVDLYSLYELDGEMNPSLTKDGVHIWPEAYDRWANAISQYIK